MYASIPKSIICIGVVVAIATTMNYGATYLFTQSFPSILATVKASGSLYMISIINIVAAVFYLFLLPETKVFVTRWIILF